MLFLEDMERRTTFIAVDPEEDWVAIADAAKSG
jgi:hypothetical protein